MKLKKGMELKVISDIEDGLIILKITDGKMNNFFDIKGIGKNLWSGTDAQE